MSTLIFVHGACVRDAAWWWSRMIPSLAERDIASVAVPLSSYGEVGEELGDLTADVDACRRAIDEVDGPVILCGHSYGGVVITEAGCDDRVTQLLYVTSVMPDAGQSQADLIGSEPAPWLMPANDGTVGVHPDLIREFFLQDCDEVTIDQALARLTRQSLRPFTQPPREIAWKQKPATYFVCTEDLATPAEVQRQRVRANARIVPLIPARPSLRRRVLRRATIEDGVGAKAEGEALAERERSAVRRERRCAVRGRTLEERAPRARPCR